MKTKEEILKQFEFKVDGLNFKVDRFEEIMLQDMSQFDEDTRIKLNRDLTKDFTNWIDNKIKAKEQVKVNIKGSTRAGKSLIALKIMYLTTKFYPDKVFDVTKIVCANQKELRVRLNTAVFGDSFLIDENAFANVGMGSMTEIQQLKDINNIIAKQNIHMVYVTPQTFLNTGAEVGLAYFGKDTKNWASRFLLYSLKGGNPSLLGFVKFNVGSLFIDTGCLIYRLTGGCTNPKRTKFEDIPKENYIYSDCIPKKDNVIIGKINTDSKGCPFYDVCTSQMAKYEHIKDAWIMREMKGGLGEREIERLEVCLKLFKMMGSFNEETGGMRLNAKNGKELKLKIKMKLPTVVNTKYTGVEVDEIIQTIISMTDTDFLKDVCQSLEIDFEETYNNIINKINKIEPKEKPKEKPKTLDEFKTKE